MEIVLIRPHTHRGLVRPAGAELDLPKAKAEWLIDIGVARKKSSRGRKKLILPEHIEGSEE